MMLKLIRNILIIFFLPYAVLAMFLLVHHGINFIEQTVDNFSIQESVEYGLSDGEKTYKKSTGSLNDLGNDGLRSMIRRFKRASSDKHDIVQSSQTNEPLPRSVTLLILYWFGFYAVAFGYIMVSQQSAD